MWVVTPHIERLLGGSHHRLVWRLLGKFTWQRVEGMWGYPPLEDAMRYSGI